MLPYLRLGYVSDPSEMQSVISSQGPVCPVSLFHAFACLNLKDFKNVMVTFQYLSNPFALSYIDISLHEGLFLQVLLLIRT